VREDGADVRRLTYAVGAERDAVYSPDGSRIAFVATRGIDPRPNIYVMGADGTRTTQLTSSNTFREISGLTWSPDGERLVFSGRRANLVDTQLDLFSMSSAGSSVTRLTTTPDIGETDPAFSPLGDRIAFTAFGVLNGPPAIWTMAPDGSDRTQLIDCLLYGCRYPAWSPDGLYMAFIEYEGTRYVRVIRVGESLVQSRPVGNSTFRPSFSPDGIKLTIAMAGDGDRYQVGTMEMDGSNKTLLTHFGVGAYPTSWGR
jgi:TolB protein